MDHDVASASRDDEFVARVVRQLRFCTGGLSSSTVVTYGARLLNRICSISF